MVGVAVLRLEVFLTECNIVSVHCKTILRNKCFKTGSVKLCKAFKSSYLGGDIVFYAERFRLFKCCLARFNRVDYILFDFRDFGIAEVSVKSVDLGCADQRTLPLRNYLYTLCCGVGSLVELSGKILHCKNIRSRQIDLGRGDIKLRFGEYRFGGVLKKLGSYIFGVVAIDYSDIL